MALGTLAGIGIKGLKALLDVDEKTMVKLMSDTPMDDAAHLLPPETIYRINNALSMSRADQLPTDLEKVPTNAQVRKLFDEALDLDEPFDLRHESMYPATAAGTPSDFYGRVQRTGRFSQPGGDALPSDDIRYQAIGKMSPELKKMIEGHSSMQFIDPATGLRTRGRVGTAEGTAIAYAPGGLETPVTAKHYESIYGGKKEDLPKNLRALKYNIENTFFKRAPTDEDGVISAGMAREWIPGFGGEQGTKGYWQETPVTKKEAEAIFKDNRNLAGNLNDYTNEDWDFVEEALAQKGVRANLFEPPTEVTRFPGEGPTRELENWVGQESLILKEILYAVDNAVSTRMTRLKTGKGGFIDDPRDWYHMGQLHDDYKEMWGEVIGTRLFLDFTNMIGATTTGAKPYRNFIAASYYDWLNFHKQLFTGQPISLRGDVSDIGSTVTKTGKRRAGATKNFTFREDLSSQNENLRRQYLSKKEWKVLEKHFDDMDEATGRDVGTTWKKIWIDPKKGDLLGKLTIDTGNNKYGIKKSGVMDKQSMDAIKAKLPDFVPGTYIHPHLAPDPNTGALQPSLETGRLVKTGRKKGQFEKTSVMPAMGGSHRTKTIEGVIRGAMENEDWLRRLVKGASELTHGPTSDAALEEISTLFRLDPLIATKGAHFAAALSGALQAVTMDKVMTNALWSRAIGDGKVLNAPDGDTYAFLAEYIADIAKGYEMDPAALQAIVWLGTQQKQVVEGVGASALRTLDERIRITTAYLNRNIGKGGGDRFTVDQVKNLIYKKVMPALGVVPGINLGLDPEGELTDAEKEDL